MKSSKMHRFFYVKAWIEKLLFGTFRFEMRIGAGMNFWICIPTKWYPYQRYYPVEPRRQSVAQRNAGMT